MKQTTETVVLGGFGSNQSESRSIEQKLQPEFIDAQCVDFCSSLRNPERTAELIMGRLSITHSAGLLSHARAVELTEGTMMPNEVIAVASPLKRNPLRLIADAMSVLRHTAEEARDNSSMRGEIASQTAALARHVLLHPRHHSSVISDIARFDSFEYASSLAKNDIPVSLVFMKNDEFFNLHKMSRTGTEKLENAMEAGVKVYEFEGRHVDFTHRPLEIIQSVRQGLGRISLDQALERNPIGSLGQSFEPIPA